MLRYSSDLAPPSRTLNSVSHIGGHWHSNISPLMAKHLISPSKLQLGGGGHQYPTCRIQLPSLSPFCRAGTRNHLPLKGAETMGCSFFRKTLSILRGHWLLNPAQQSKNHYHWYWVTKMNCDSALSLTWEHSWARECSYFYQILHIGMGTGLASPTVWSWVAPHLRMEGLSPEVLEGSLSWGLQRSSPPRCHS